MIVTQAWAALGRPLTTETVATANLAAVLVAAWGLQRTIVAVVCIALAAGYVWLWRHKPRVAALIAVFALAFVVGLLTARRR